MAYEKNPDGSYADLEYTKFPAEIDSWQNSEDVTAEYLSLANDYKSALLAGNYGNAKSILDANPQLKRMIITAEDINKTKHATMALERMFTEDIDAYVKSFTDRASSEAEKSTTSATNAALSESNANNYKEIAQEKAAEASQLVENLKILKGTLPSDFTDYVDQVNSCSSALTDHNISSDAHQDIRKAIKDAKYILPAATADTIGGVKIGSGLNVTEDGTLSSDAYTKAEINALLQNLNICPFEVGDVLHTTSSVSPAARFGGTWEQIASERVLMGVSSSHAAGTTAEAGLPNITGSTGRFASTYDSHSSNAADRKQGALNYSGEAYNMGYYSSSGSAGYGYYINFNASKSNAIYGKSSTVQPAAYYVHIWRRTA